MSKQVWTEERLERFVRAWQESESVAEIANKLGETNLKSLSVRASNLRKKGVPLKKLGASMKIDYDKLANLARAMDKTNDR